VIKGEAGIGKTSLVQTFVHWVQHQGGTARMASCYRNEEMLPYNPVISWLRSFTLTGLPFFWLREIALIAPELVEFLPPNTQNLETGQRQKLFLALAHATLQQNQPILLALDDAQLADHYTLEWLLFLLHHNPRARLMIVLTRNINEISQDHPLFQMRPELQPSRRFTEISLKRLIRSDARLIADRLAGRPLAEHMLDLLYEFSEGNPFFIVEAIRAYGLAFGDTDSMGSAISESSLKQIPSVQALISRRLAHLSTDAQKILEAAAVMGHSFQADVILLASCIDEDTLLSGLEELWRRGLIIECDQQRFEFQHRLLRHYIYDGMSKSRRKYLHQRVSQALQEEYFS
jgi:predicted ATPase